MCTCMYVRMCVCLWPCDVHLCAVYVCCVYVCCSTCVWDYVCLCLFVFAYTLCVYMCMGKAHVGYQEHLSRVYCHDVSSPPPPPSASGHPLWCRRWSACYSEGWAPEGEREAEGDCLSAWSSEGCGFCSAGWPGEEDHWLWSWQGCSSWRYVCLKVWALAWVL